MHPSFDHPNYLGGRHGGHRHANTTASSGAHQISGYTIRRAPAQTYAAYAAQLTAIATDLSRQTAPAIESAGIRAGEIIGHRAWMVINGRLHSMFAPFCWEPGEQPAVTGMTDFAYGYHAFKQMESAAARYIWMSTSRTVVFGRVALWGAVIEHERGYRAEHAAIESLDEAYTEMQPSCISRQFWRPGDHRLRALRQLYGV